MSFASDLRAVAAQKDPKGIPGYTLWVNRPLGGVVAAAAHRVRMTPNQLTLISGLMASAALLLLVLRTPTTPNSVLVGGLLCLAFVFDSADGQLARLSGRTTYVGEWLDHVIDAGKHLCLPLAIFIAAQRFLDVPWGVLLIPLAYQLVAVLTFTSMVLTDLLLRSAESPRPEASPREIRRTALVKLPVDYGVLCLSVMLFGSDVFWFAYGALLLIFSSYFVLHVRVSIKRLDELGRRRREAASARGPEAAPVFVPVPADTPRH